MSLSSILQPSTVGGNIGTYDLWCHRLNGNVFPTPVPVTSIANEGTGTGLVFDAVVGTTANLRSLLEDVVNVGVSIATVGPEVVIGNTMTGLNLEAAGPTVGRVFKQKSGPSLEFRTLDAGLNVTLSETATGILISAVGGGGGLSGLANEGGGAEVFDTLMGATAVLRTLVGTANGATVTQNATTLTIDNTLTGTNVGVGAGVFRDKTAASLNLRSIVAGANITATQNADDVTIAATGVLTTLANEGGGADVFDNVVGTTAYLRSFIGTSNGLTVTQGATDITVDNTLTGSNIGIGTGTVFSAKSGASLQFNTLEGTANGLTVSAPAANVITIDNTLTGSNVGAGTGTIFSAKSGASLQLNTLAGTANGLTVSAPAANVITIDNTLTGANVGAGSGIFRDKTTSNINLRSLIAAASSGLTLTQNANDITISATAGTVVTSIANEGAGSQVYDTTNSTATAALLRSIVAGTNITVTQNANNITIGATSVTAAHWYGTGFDGSATIAGNTTLTSDKYYTDLTINTGISLFPDGYRIFVSGTLTLTGTGKINGDGTNGGTGNSGGSGGTTVPNGTIGGGTAGGAGGALVGAGVAGGNQANPVIGRVGGVGGTGDNGVSAGGVAGTASNPTTDNGGPSILYEIIDAVRGRDLAGNQFRGGTGGGGGGGGISNKGGGGGGGGGVVIVCAKTITGGGTISANGGTGGMGGTGAANQAGGGGGGGGAGCVIVVSESFTGGFSAASITAIVGAGGAGGGSGGAAGTNGAGFDGRIAIFV